MKNTKSADVYEHDEHGWKNDLRLNVFLVCKRRMFKRFLVGEISV